MLGLLDIHIKSAFYFHSCFFKSVRFVLSLPSFFFVICLQKLTEIINYTYTLIHILLMITTVIKFKHRVIKFI